MKCHLCNIDLISYSIWNVGEGNLARYRCKNKDCVGVPDDLRMGLNVILPSKQIVDYFFCFQIKEEWYGVLSYSERPLTKLFQYFIQKYPNNEIGFTSTLLFDVERFYPLVGADPFSPQLEMVFNKLKILILFS